MKIFTSLFLSFVFTLCSYAQTAILTFSTTGNYNLKIRFNGTKYTLRNRNATFENLAPGVYPVQVFRMIRKSNGDFEYIEAFNGNVALSANRHKELMVMRYGGVYFDEGDIESDTWADNVSTNSGSGNGGGNNGSGYSQAVTAAQFELIKKGIKDGYYDNSMLINAKAILKNNLINLNQTKELVKLFSYDETKLNFLKFAYDFCTEKGLFFSLTDELYYSNTKKSLLDFIATK